MSLTLTAGANSIEFGVTAGFGLFGEVARNFTAARRIVVDIPYGTGNPFIDMPITGEIEWVLQNVRVAGTSADDLAGLLHDLNAILAVSGTATDSLAGSSHTVTWVRNPSLPVLAGRTQHLETRSVWEGSVTFYTMVVGTGAAANLYTENTLSSPNLWAIGALSGDAPAPLDLSLMAGWDTTTNGIRDAVVALVDTATLTDYVYAATDATGWATSAGAHRTNSATWDDDNYGPVPSGRWRVFALAHRENAETGYLSLSEDGVEAMQSVTLTTINYRLYSLGEWISNGVEDLHVLGKGSDYVWVYRLILVPAASYTSFSYDGGGHVDVWDLNGTPTFTLADTTVVPAVKYMTGNQLYAATSGKYLLVCVAPLAGTEFAPGIYVTLDYTPQHWTWAAS